MQAQNKQKLSRRKNAPPSTGRFFCVEDEIMEAIEQASASLKVTKTYIINEALRQGLGRAIQILDNPKNQ